MLQYKRLENDGWTQFRDRRGSEVRWNGDQLFTFVTNHINTLTDNEREK